jgi:hypothetical protein
MRRWGAMAAVVGLLWAVAVPARAESARRERDEDGKAKAVKAPQAPKPATRASDTLVVPAAGPDRPGFTMVGENVTYADPSFVPYKLREAARRARANADLSKIP